MNDNLAICFPGGSKSRVNRAGENVRDGNASDADFQVIDEWRAAHRAVLNTFQAILHKRARGKDIIVAQRHKRKRTVFDKLVRQQRMNLSRMDDVTGCRLIFRNIDELNEFRASFQNARFRHKRRNDVVSTTTSNAPNLQVIGGFMMCTSMTLIRQSGSD
jgi:putative GTP pyrophosphokinase